MTMLHGGRPVIDDEPTLRDVFAMVALHAMVSGRLPPTGDLSAEVLAYRCADNMLAERAKKLP